MFVVCVWFSFSMNIIKKCDTCSQSPYIYTHTRIIMLILVPFHNLSCLNAFLLFLFFPFLLIAPTHQIFHSLKHSLSFFFCFKFLPRQTETHNKISDDEILISSCQSHFSRNRTPKYYEIIQWITSQVNKKTFYFLTFYIVRLLYARIFSYMWKRTILQQFPINTLHVSGF